MIEQSHPPSYETFETWVRDLLNHFYDVVYLQEHPLTHVLANSTEDVLQRSQEVRRTLLAAVRSLHPGPGVPVQAPDWRTYRILKLRYVEGHSPEEVMEEVALGKSHFYHEQAQAVKVVAKLLWDRWQQERVEHEEQIKTPKGTTHTSNRREDLAQAEVERLRNHAQLEEVDVGGLLTELKAVIAPLAQLKELAVRFDVAGFSVPHADIVMLRQAFLNLITYALDIPYCTGVVVQQAAGELGLVVSAQKKMPQLGTPLLNSQRQGIGLEIGRALLATMGGTLDLEDSTTCWRAEIKWPEIQTPILLVVDDNERLVALYCRYLVGYHWRVVSATNGTEMRDLLGKLTPSLIILDVMMPQEDGWQLLAHLQQSPTTKGIPVIICSVLNEPQLACALGASGYLSKPVSRRDLLNVLNLWGLATANQVSTHHR